MQVQELRAATADGNKWTLKQLQERWDDIVASPIRARPTQDIDRCLETLEFVRIDSNLDITIAIYAESETA